MSTKAAAVVPFGYLAVMNWIRLLLRQEIEQRGS